MPVDVVQGLSLFFRGDQITAAPLPGESFQTPFHPLRHSFFTSIPFQLSTPCFARYRRCRSLSFSQSLLEYKHRRNHVVYEAIGPPGLAPGKFSCIIPLRLARMPFLNCPALVHQIKHPFPA